MSSIRWHFASKTLEMGGRERAWMDLLCRNVAESVIRLRFPEAQLSPAWHMVSGESSFGLLLNTVCTMGSPALKLAAQIHGRCETNTLIEPAAFPEIADALETGLQTGIFRAETQGYDTLESIVAHLRNPEPGDEWCVWSYSVTDGFPRWDEARNDFLDEEESAAQIREEGNVLASGDLLKPTPFYDGRSFWTVSDHDLSFLKSPRGASA